MRERMLAELMEDTEAREAEREPAAPETSSAEVRERVLADVVRDTEVREMERAPRSPEGVPVRRVVLTGIATLIALWLWILPPAPLRTPPVPRVPEARLEAGVRFAIALQAERIGARRLEARRLPDLLREAGDTLPGLVYERVDGGTFLLRGTVDGQVLEYRSDTPLRDFLGDAPWVLAGGAGGGS